MSLISFTPIADGVTAVNAAATNTPLSTIYNDYNGNITDANIAANAAIAGSKINLASIANPYKFSVYLNTATNSANTLTLVQFDTKTYDTGTNVDIVTHKGRFTAPIAGFYHFSANIGNSSLGATGQIIATLYKNGSLARTGAASTMGAAGSVAIAPVSADLQLAANDYVEVFFQGGSGSTMAVGQTGNNFDGFLISAT